jgi:hypothetical protein
LFEEEKEKHQRLKAKYLQAQVDIKDQQTQLKQAIDVRGSCFGIWFCI